MKHKRWQDPRTPVSIEWVGQYKVTIYDQEQYDQSLVDYPDDGKALPNKNLDNTKPAFAKQKPQARWNWTHKLDQPLNVCGISGAKFRTDTEDENVCGIRKESDIIRNFIEAREKQGHLFFWNEYGGIMHFPPRYGDTSCDSFIKKHEKALGTFLQERKVKA